MKPRSTRQWRKSQLLRTSSFTLSRPAPRREIGKWRWSKRASALSSGLLEVKPWIVVAVAAANAIACTHRPIYVEPSPNGVVLTGGKLGMYHKEVMTKKDPDTLVA